MKEYEFVSTNCVNSKHPARFLVSAENEWCQCPFSCKVQIRHIRTGHVYVVTKSELTELIVPQEPISKDRSQI